MKCLSWLSVISNMCFPRDYVIEILEPMYFTLFMCSVYLYAIARVCYLNILTMYILRKNYQGLISLLHGFQKNFFIINRIKGNIYIYINFLCQVLMSKYIYKKLRHLFTKKLYLGFFQTFKNSIK